MQQLWCTEITHWASSLWASMLCRGGVSVELSLPRAHSSAGAGHCSEPSEQLSAPATPAASTSRSSSPLPLIVKTTQPVAAAGRGAGLPPRPYFIVKNNTQQKRNYFPCIKRGLTKRFKNSILNPFLKNSYTYFHSQFPRFFSVCQAPETGNSLSHLKQTWIDCNDKLVLIQPC